MKAGRSRFTLSTLPATDFPTVDEIAAKQTLARQQAGSAAVDRQTHFSMAQQDVRYYLNGLLLETERKNAALRRDRRPPPGAVGGRARSARDARRADHRAAQGRARAQRLLDGDGDVELALGANHIRVKLDGVRLTSKLIDGRFPDYARVIPIGAEERDQGRPQPAAAALQRTAILSNEKYRGVRLELSPNSVVLQANNPEQEEAVEKLEVEYAGDAMESAST